MSRLLTYALLCCLGVAAQAQVQSPEAGIVRYPSGEVRRLLGINHTYVAGPVLWPNAQSVSFFDQVGLIADGENLVLIDTNTSQSIATTPLVDPKLVLGLSAAYSPATATVLIWNGHTFVSAPLPLSPDTQLVSLSIRGENVALLLRTGETWQTSIFDTGTGTLSGATMLTTPAGTLYVWNNCAFVSVEGKLSAACEGTPDPIQIAGHLDPATLVFEPASHRALHIYSRTARRHWLAFQSDGHVAIAELPGAKP